MMFGEYTVGHSPNFNYPPSHIGEIQVELILLSVWCRLSFYICLMFSASFLGEYNIFYNLPRF